MRRLYNKLATIKGKDYWIKLKGSLKKDLQQCLTFLQSYNSVTFFPDLEWLSRVTLHCFSDSSKKGYDLAFYNSLGLRFIPNILEGP